MQEMQVHPPAVNYMELQNRELVREANYASLSKSVYDNNEIKQRNECAAGNGTSNPLYQ